MDKMYNMDRNEIARDIKTEYPSGTKFLIEVEIDTLNIDPTESIPQLGYYQILNCLLNKEKADNFSVLTGTKINKIYRPNEVVPETHTLRDCLNILTKKVNEIYDNGTPV